MTNKTFCILPFIHLQIKPSGQFKPCCRFDFHNPSYINEKREFGIDQYSIKTKTMQETFNSEFWEDIRQRMLSGKEVIGCSKCYLEEQRGNYSMRRYQNLFRNNGNDEGLNIPDPYNLKYIEMTFGNYCNLKCRTCNSNLSSTWYEDDQQLLKTKFYSDRYSFPKIVNVPFNWRAEDFLKVEEIKFTGGEPMIHPDFLPFLDILIDNNLAKNITLEVFSNCSWMPGLKYTSRLEKFKCVKISLSIDGHSKVNDYIRFPSQWETVEKAARSWLVLEKANPDIYQVVLNPTINIYNILNLTKILSWWFDINNQINTKWIYDIYKFNFINSKNIKTSGKFIINVLHHPSYLSINLLPYSYRQKLFNDIENFIQIYINNEINKIHRYVEEEGIIKKTTQKYWPINDIVSKITTFKNLFNDKDSEKEIELFLNYTYDLDKLRQNNFAEEIPELYEIFKDYTYTGVINE